MTNAFTNEVAGIDLSYRPTSYFWPMGLERHLLARIKGAERRAVVERLLAAGGETDVLEFLSRSSLDDDERRAIGRLHPACMGGEYLPDLAEREVEIARIEIASVTSDVTSVFARRGRRRIYYRVVDEYGGETLSRKTERTSTRPLTLGQLETFLNGAWSIFNVLAMNFGRRGYDADEIRRFSSVSSQFYPQIGALYRARIEAWIVEQRRKAELRRAESVDSGGRR